MVVRIGVTCCGNIEMSVWYMLVHCVCVLADCVCSDYWCGNSDSRYMVMEMW